ncbi:MAG: chemotaxis protein CheD [Myxococcales bacterium]
MKTLVVEISGLQVSDDADAECVTFALGSCIGVTAWDPKRRAGGMLHYLLPLSSIAPDKAASNPFMFADLGVPLLFERLYALGCHKQDLVVTACGGATINDDRSVFDVGKRNYTTLRKMFWKNDVLITAEDVGGTAPRTVRLNIGTGRVTLRMNGTERALWAATGDWARNTEAA